MNVDPMDRFASQVLLVRERRVMLDADLAKIYGVTTSTLIQAVKRNLERFPMDFAFQLNASETVRLRSQIAASDGQTALSIHPWVFTDHGALMAAFALHSKNAIQMSVHIVRASVRLRELVASDEWLAKRLDELERRALHHDEESTSVVRAIRKLATPRKPNSNRRIGLISGD